MLLAIRSLKQKIMADFRPDGVPPVTDGLILCLDGNNPGSTGWKNLYGAQDKHSLYTFRGFVTSEYGTYGLFPSNQLSGIRYVNDERNFTSDMTLIHVVHYPADQLYEPLGCAYSKCDIEYVIRSSYSSYVSNNETIDQYYVDFKFNPGIGKNITAKLSLEANEIPAKPSFIAYRAHAEAGNHQVSIDFNGKKASATNTTAKTALFPISPKQPLYFLGHYNGLNSYDDEKRVYALYAYNRVLSDEEIARVYAYAAQRYHIPV